MQQATYPVQFSVDYPQRLKELIESGSGLFDSTVEPGQTPRSREVNDVSSSREQLFLTSEESSVSR